MGLSKAIRELQQFRDDFLDGAFPQRSALGPGSLSSTLLKSKSITSSMIDVSELAAVATNTGSLTVTGGMSVAAGITIGSNGRISSGQTNYDTGTGFWFDYNGGTPRFSLGNSAGNKMTWDGATLAITGTLTITNPATAGIPYAAASAAGGAALTVDGGGTFTGALEAASGTFAGAITAASGAISGTLTLTSAASKIIDADGSYWDNTGLVLISTNVYGDSIRWRVAGNDSGTITASATDLIMAQGSLSVVGSVLSLGSTNWVLASVGGAMLRSSGNDFKAYGNFYPGLGTLGVQSANYLNTDGSYMAVRGAGLKVYGDLLSTASIAGSNIYPGGQTTRFFSDNGSALTTSAGLTVSGTLTATAFSGPLTTTGTVTAASVAGGSMSGSSLGVTGLVSAANIAASALVQGATVTSTGLMTAATLRVNSTSGGGTNTDVSISTAAGLDVVLSDDNGASFAFVPLRWFTVNVNGADRKVLCVI